MKNTLVCIPTYNESENVPQLIKRLFSLYPEISVLIVDDNSPDGTARIAEEMKSTYPNLHVLNRAGLKKGFANSYKDGFKYAFKKNFAWLLQMDADFSHDPSYIAHMINVREKFDLVIGSRYTSGGKVANWPLKRRILSRGGNLYARLWLQSTFADMTGGFNMWRTAALQSLAIDSLNSDGYSFLIELKFHAFRAGLRAKEIAITFTDRTAAVSKMSPTIFREAVFAVPLLRIFRNPKYPR